MAATLTKRQREVLSAIERFAAASGYPPTLRELAATLGISGISAVKKHLDAIAAKGYISRDRRARAISVRRARSVSVPVLGRVAAGRPLLAEANLEGAIAIDRDALRGGQYFFLRVQGDSMRDVGILDGDHVLVRVQPQAEDGAIVVALIEDAATVKRLRRRGAVVELHAENPAYSPICVTRADALRVLGKVVGVIRLPQLRG